MISLSSKNNKGGKNKTNSTPQNTEKDWKLNSLQLIKYKDHIAYRNTSPNGNTLSERITIGWLIKETDEYVEICWDLPTWLQKHEVYDQMSGMKIMKSSILERYWFH